MGRRRGKGKRKGNKQKGSQDNIIEEPTDEELFDSDPSTTARNKAQQKLASPQYQHYIPRFIIRNFALDDHLKHSKERHHIYYYSLDDQRFRIADVDTSFGVYDMYADIQNAENLNWVELELSILEQKASGIINRILAERHEITLTYSELVNLRKFLWIMSFRFPSRRRQYTENRFCDHGKRVEMEFMNAKGRSSLDDVWLENIRGFLLETVDDALDITYDDIAKKRVRGDIGHMEHIDYKFHVKHTFLCIWDAPESYEFILTDNGFAVYETCAGRALPSQAHHYFYPISPRRIIVCSNIWFKPDSDLFADIAIKTAKELLGIDPQKSWLAQVPHLPPKNRYYQMPEGPFQIIDGGPNPLSESEKSRIRKARRYATYTYPLVTLKKEDVDKVNACFLNEVTEAITFRNPTAMIRTIRQWRKHLRTNFFPNIFPPSVLPNYPYESWSSVPKFISRTFQNLDVKQLFRVFDYLDPLERELKREINRTHAYKDTVQGVEILKKDGCWMCDLSDQPAKLSWRRSGREKREVSNVVGSF